MATVLPFNGFCQKTSEPIDSVNHKRLHSVLIAGGLGYSAMSIGLYKSWYEDNARTKFHSFNDWNEWKNMDKFGHLTSTYHESYLAYSAAKWVGFDEKKSILLGVGSGLLFQTTIEMMDGFSEKWGFSWTDIGFNVLGAAGFASQQIAWNEQRIQFKFSANLQNYSELPFPNGSNYSPKDRADDLFGATKMEKLLKDYNGQTYWLSVNPYAFSPKSAWPKWLNLAAGIGIKNVLGGFENEWTFENADFQYNKKRQYEFYFSPDVNWTALKGEKGLLNTVLDLMNILKFPAPAIEYNRQSGWEFHLIFY